MTTPAVQRLRDLAAAARLAGNVSAAEALTQAAAITERYSERVATVKTLRDEAALAALPALIDKVFLENLDAEAIGHVAVAAYGIADAMLDARTR